MVNYQTDAPAILREFLSYHETIKAHSKRTVDEYFLDLRNFFRYLKKLRDPALADVALDEIDILDVDLDFVGDGKGRVEFFDVENERVEEFVRMEGPFPSDVFEYAGTHAGREGSFVSEFGSHSAANVDVVISKFKLGRLTRRVTTKIVFGSLELERVVKSAGRGGTRAESDEGRSDAP